MIQVITSTYTVQNKNDAEQCARSFISSLTALVQSDHPQIILNDDNIDLRESIIKFARYTIPIDNPKNKRFSITIIATVKYPYIIYRITSPDGDETTVIETI